MRQILKDDNPYFKGYNPGERVYWMVCSKDCERFRKRLATHWDTTTRVVMPAEPAVEG